MTKPSNRIERTERHLRWVRLGDLRVSDRAQRSFRQYHADRLEARFDIEDFGNPEVNHRHHDDCTKFCDGCPVWVMDGQHRAAALRQWLGDGWEDQKIQCWVTEGKTEAQEAETFLRFQCVLSSGAFDDFKVALTAGREVESDIDRQLRHDGFVLSRAKAPGAVSCPGTLKKVYQFADVATLGRTLRNLHNSFGDSGLEAKLIEGMALVCHRYNGDLSDDVLVAKLARLAGGSGGLMGKAATLRQRTRQPIAQCVAASIVEVANRGKGGKKLPSWWKSDTP